ncbi:hypothetical protein BLA29_010451, partial [Euroglyphus maynei]
LAKPNAFETCGLQTCSYWSVGQWSECQGCIDIQKGRQWRNVECRHHNGTIIMDESECYQWSDKPIIGQECYHMNCIPMWKIFNQQQSNDDGDEESSNLNGRKCHNDNDHCNHNDAFDSNGSNQQQQQQQQKEINESRTKLIHCVWNDVRLQDQIIDESYCTGLMKPTINDNVTIELL